MPLAALPTTVNPSYPLSRDKSPRVLKAQFGDGYQARAADGINSSPLSLELSWGVLTKTQRDELFNFFDARNGVEAFTWTIPDTGQAFVWVCPRWGDRLVDIGVYSITATFEQVYEFAL